MNTTLLHLTLIDKIGPGVIEHILTHKPEDISWSDLYQFSTSDFMQTFQITPHKAELIKEGLANDALLQQELKLIEQLKVKTIFSYEDHYPAALKSIHLPPAILYYHGSFSPEKNHIAIVGSRKMSAYGAQVVKHMASPLISSHVVIVSGGALGVDALAHQLAVEQNGKTIAVLGSGLGNIYPRQNKKLFEQIVNSGGAVISPFPLLMEPFPGNFPARNRIIAGLSSSCIVIQAGRKSGARITAQFALEQGKTVYAVPGSIFDELSEGCHALIEEGATALYSINQLTSALNLSQTDALTTQTSLLPDALEKPYGQDQNQSIEGVITQLCRIPISFDEIQEQTNLNFIELNDILFNLQISGKIVQNSIGLWSRLSG